MPRGCVAEGVRVRVARGARRSFRRSRAAKWGCAEGARVQRKTVCRGADGKQVGARGAHVHLMTDVARARTSSACRVQRPPLEGRIERSAWCAQGATIALTRHTVLRCTRAPSAQPHFAALLLRNDRRAPRATLTHTPSATHPRGTSFSLQRGGLCEAHRIYEAIAEGKAPTH